MRNLGILIIVLVTTSLIVAGGRYNYSSSSSTNTNYDANDALALVQNTYDMNGISKGVDGAYDATWDGDPNAPEKDDVYDKIQDINTAALPIISTASITFTIVDGNGYFDANYTDIESHIGGGANSATVTALVTLSGVDANDPNLGVFSGSTIPDYNTVKGALQALESALEGKSGHVYSFTITEPNNYYDTNDLFPIDVNVASALALMQVKVTCSINPATELDVDLKYADDVNLANAATISALDTTAGKSTTALTSSVAATKFLYIDFAARPDPNIDWIRFDIQCSTSEFDFAATTIVEPNVAYDVNTLFYVDYAFNACTYSQIQFKCDIDPTAEPNITLYYGDVQNAAAGTKICDIDTTAGKVTVSSFDDATITAGSDIWGVWNARPDANIKWEAIKIARTDD